MAITRIGSLVEIETDGANTGSQSVSVPADATLMIVGVVGYSGTVAYFSTAGQITIAGAALTAVAGDSSTSFFMGTLAYKVSPTTGTQTLAWDWVGSGTQVSDGWAIIVYGFYKGIDTGSPTRDTYGGQEGSSPHATDTMTALTSDMAISWGFQFGGGPDTTLWTMTNATEISEFLWGIGDVHGSAAVWAEASPSGNVQITATASTSGDGGMTAIVFKAAAEEPPATTFASHSRPYIFRPRLRRY